MSAVADRIDILDESGQSIGWVDPRSGARNLTDPLHAREFEEMVDFWLSAAGVEDVGTFEAPTSKMRVNEVRFPDPPVVRSLVIPLRPLG
jgi:hypothetical protein